MLKTLHNLSSLSIPHTNYHPLYSRLSPRAASVCRRCCRCRNARWPHLWLRVPAHAR